METLTTQSQLIQFLRNLGSQCQFVSLLTNTEPKMRKTGNPYVGVRKISRRNGLLNINYADSVSRKIAVKVGLPENQVEYIPKATWYMHEDDGNGRPIALCRHQKDDTKYYLQYFPVKSFDTTYVMPNGDIVPEENLKPFLQESYQVDFKPAVITLGLDSIVEMKAKGMSIETNFDEQF